jgi:galactokinase
MGLEVITLAINQRIEIEGKTNTRGKIVIHLEDLKRKITFPNKKQKKLRRRDYARSAFNIYQKFFPEDFGAELKVRSNLPIGKGLSSSSAFCAALIGFFDKAAEYNSTEKELAWNAYLAEVVNLGEPGGMMDHYASVIGNLVYLECREPYNLEKFDIKLEGLVIGDTLTKKETIQTLITRKSEIYQGIEIMKKNDESFDLGSCSFEDVFAEYTKNHDMSLKRLLGILGIRDTVREGYGLMRSKNPLPEEIASLINKHHEYQQTYFENVTPKMQKLISCAKDKGAIGCKLLGSGNGGSFLAYSPGNEERIAKAIIEGGGQAYILEQDNGLKIDIIEN